MCTYNICLADNIWNKNFINILNEITEKSIFNLQEYPFDWKKYTKNVLDNNYVHDKQSYIEGIKYAINCLNDKHSYVLISNQDFDKKNEFAHINKQPKIERLGTVGYIKIYPFNITNPKNQEQVYGNSWIKKSTDKLRKFIDLKYWIIDLRENSGGNMYPMLAFLFPFYSSENIGGFQYYNKSNIIIKLIDYKLMVNDNVIFQYKISPFHIQAKKIIVLIGENTASSGEFIANSFKGQDNVILAGTRTYGLANGNEILNLPENLGYLVLNTSFFLNRQLEPIKENYVTPDINIMKNINIIEYSMENILHVS